MTTTRLVGIAVAALALAGCGTTGTVTMGSGSGGTRSLATTQADCPDTFTKGEVNGCPASASGGSGYCSMPVNVVWDGKACQVMVGAQTFKMAKGHANAILRWWLPAASIWEFREESSLYALPINFTDQNAPDLRNQFFDRNVVANGKVVLLKNKNSNTQPYQYQIRVFKKNGRDKDFIESTDPVIYNDF